MKYPSELKVIDSGTVTNTTKIIRVLIISSLLMGLIASAVGTRVRYYTASQSFEFRLQYLKSDKQQEFNVRTCFYSLSSIAMTLSFGILVVQFRKPHVFDQASTKKAMVILDILFCVLITISSILCAMLQDFINSEPKFDAGSSTVYFDHEVSNGVAAGAGFASAVFYVVDAILHY